MRLRLLATLLCTALLLGRVASAEPLSPEDQPIRLFNGRDLSGFYIWLVDTHHDDPRNVFSVTNGLLRISGDGLGYLATRKSYRDYHLIAEFRWGETNWNWGDRIGKARDSGIFLHAWGPDGNSHDGRGAFMAAIECNLFQGATGDILLIRGTDRDGMPLSPRIRAETAAERDRDGWFTWKPGGEIRTIERWGRLNWRLKDREWRDELNFRGPHDPEHPYGEWNLVECICSGTEITIRINGTTVNRVLDAHPSSGKILLQCEGSEIYSRRLELLRIGER